VDFEGRVRQAWSIHCPQEVLLSYYVVHSELKSAIIGKSLRCGYQRRAIKIIVPLILFHVSSASLCLLDIHIGVRLNLDLRISRGCAPDMILSIPRLVLLNSN
ncbi:hypothetical protein H5410_047165, partial [Solanum commersonii]